MNVVSNVIELNLRPSDVVLDRVYNPAQNKDFAGATPAQLAEACGFCYSFKGIVNDHDGTYQSEYEEDEPMAPLARFIFEGFECFVYEYGIASIRDRATRETKIARFD